MNITFQVGCPGKGSLRLEYLSGFSVGREPSDKKKSKIMPHNENELMRLRNKKEAGRPRHNEKPSKVNLEV